MKYMSKFHSYVGFKQKHPYSEAHPDFEHEVTPVTILDKESNTMNCYLPDTQSRSTQILTKFRTLQRIERKRAAVIAQKLAKFQSE